MKYETILIYLFFVEETDFVVVVVVAVVHIIIHIKQIIFNLY
jgi:hypothetical protein